TPVLAACAAGLMDGSTFTGQAQRLPCFALGSECTMRDLLQQWSALMAAVLVVFSIVAIRSTLRTQLGGVHDRLSTLEKNIESIRQVLEGNQGIAVRMATLDIRVNEQLQNLMAQRDTSLERHEQDTFNTQEAVQALQTTVDTIATMTQRIAFVEEMLLEMQG